jgi:hypothetical protein
MTKSKKACWMIVAIVLLISALQLYVLPTQATPALAAGINYMSSGNQWTESDSQLNADFKRFADDGIIHISARIMWSVMEPQYYSDSAHLSNTALANFKRVLAAAEKNGISVNVDFWTQHGYTLGLPSWVGSYWDIEGIASTRDKYVRYMKAVVDAIKDYKSIESYTILNEPWWGSASNGVYVDKSEYQAAFPILYDAIKSEDPNRLVTCRFTLSYTPGSGKFDTSVYGMFDIFAVTLYLDPSNPSDTRYNGRWSYWDKTVADCKARNKTLWVIEFGDDSSNLEHNRLHYQNSLSLFANAGAERAYAWAWQTRSYSSESFNIYHGTPDPAYYELAKYPDGNSPSPPPPQPQPSPQPSPQPAPSPNFEDSFESQDFSKWTGTVTSRGETATVRDYRPYQGRFHARFASDGYQSTENAYCFIAINESDVFTMAYVYIASGLPLANNGDHFDIIRFSANGTLLAAVGIERIGGVDRISVNARSGSTLVGPAYSSSVTISTGHWYCIELHWKKTQLGLVELYLNGEKILIFGLFNRGSLSNADEIDFGIISAMSIQKRLIVYGDNFVYSRNYVDPEPRG